MKTPYPATLVLGTVPSLTWMVARCLRRAGGAPVILAWHALSPLKLTADCSDYISWSSIHKRDEKLDASALEKVRLTCKRKGIEQVLAADYDTALLLAECAGDAAIPAALVPRACTISSFNNKWTLSRLLDHLALPYPESAYISCAQALLDIDLAFPVITKPLDKWASVGFEIHRTRAELEQRVARDKLKSPFPLIAQRYVPGWDVGASFLAKDGRLAAYSIFQNRQRGERVFYEDARVSHYLATFVEASNYSGVGHIDMRYDPACDQYRILELNPRFWASLLYAADAGLNYPDLLLRIEHWDRHSVRRARSGAIRLRPYERAMTLSNRWFSVAYEKVTRAKL